MRTGSAVATPFISGPANVPTGLRVASIIKWIDSALACGMPRGNCCPGGGSEAWYFMLPLDEICRQQIEEGLLGNQFRPVAGAGNLECAQWLFILGGRTIHRNCKVKVTYISWQALNFAILRFSEDSHSSIIDNYPDKCQWFPSQELTNWNSVSTISVLCSRSKQLSSGCNKYAQPRPPHAHDTEVSQNGPIRLTVTSELSQLWAWLNGFSLCLYSTADT